ncbi:MAG: acyclic terpene utilization AtuA family protein [Clostridia bacterium]|nr:acyclic terpene utilization AtuA family protein [Clostridia bacterium]
MSKQEMKILSATGIVGYGFSEDSLRRGMERKPDVLGCDAGSTDPGPFYLGSGTAFVSREACKRDASLLIKAARGAGIPLIIGTSGGSGGDANLQWFLDIVMEIIRENDLHMKLAVIHSEQDKAYVRSKAKQGKVKSMGALPELTDHDIDEAEHIVGLLGAEPFIAAIEQGADIVIAGRASDTSIFASMPIKEGFDPGLAWHAAKLLECGAMSAEPANAGDCILVTMRRDHFLVEPLNPAQRHTTVSTAAHALYENASPYQLYEAGGMLDLSNARYEQVDERTVRVSGSKFVPDCTYRIKLEAAAKVGYRTISIMGTRDPILIGQIDDYLEMVRSTVQRRVDDAFKGEVKQSDYRLAFHVYGKNAIMGEWDPNKDVAPNELGIVIDVVASNPELSKVILAFSRTFTLHHDFPGRKCIAGNMAVAFSPSDIPMGPVYRFNMEHLIEPNDPFEMFRTEILDL